MFKFPILIFFKEVFWSWNNIFGVLSNILLILSIVGLFSDLKIPSIIIAIISMISSFYRVWLDKFQIIKMNQSKTIDIQILPNLVEHILVLEMFNNGNQDIILNRITVEWEQQDGIKTRVLNKFLPEGSDVIKDIPRKQGIFRRKDKIWALETPNSSTNNLLKVVILAKVVNSEIEQEIEKVIENYNSYYSS